MYVVDASIAVKWFLLEQGSPQARIVREQHVAGDIELAAPDLIAYEVANALVCRRTLDPAEVAAAVDSILTMEMTLWAPETTWMGHAGRLAAQLGASFYDSAYVALAHSLSWELLTADLKLQQIARPVVTVRSLNDLC
ncbi:MAG: type II toxin-antitoxin system VapC family toxin [Planctomycetota bacterium]